MNWKRSAWIFGLCVFALFSRAHMTHAAEIGDSTIVERKTFYLDWGFIGRPVSLDMNQGKTVVSWDAGDLVAPTILFVEIEKTSTSSLNGVLLGDEIVHLTWTDPFLLSSRGVKVTQACAPDASRVCTTYLASGLSWKEAVDSRAYGYAHVRSGLKNLPYMRLGDASWYKYKDCLCAASPDFPKGTLLRVTRQDRPERSVVVRVNDYGPERNLFPERAIDLDAVAFASLVSLRAGVITVIVEPVSSTTTPLSPPST